MKDQDTDNEGAKYQKILEMEKAWLIWWRFFSPDEDKSLEELGIKNKIIDIISAREGFGTILEKSKEIYIHKTQSLAKRAYFAHYHEGRERRDKFLKQILYTYMQSDKYQQYIKLINEDAEKERIGKARKELSKISIIISIGHDPSLVVERVSGIAIYENGFGMNKIEWNSFSGGEISRKEYEYYEGIGDKT